MRYHYSLLPCSILVINMNSSRRTKRNSVDDAGVVVNPAKRIRSSSSDREWNQKFFELMLYRARNGNILVRQSDEHHKSLYKWITQQRKEYRRFSKDPRDSILNEDRIKVLESIYFTFGTRNEENWFYHFEQLKQYKERHGHVLVPRESEIHGLGDWVVTQRIHHGLMNEGKESQMSQDRKELLDSVGFVWQVRNRPGWQTRYEELLEYKSKFGNTKVPQNYSENKGLGKWVSKQRTEYKNLQDGKKSLLTPDRIEKLEDIGFAWYGRERAEDFDELDFD